MKGSLDFRRVPGTGLGDLQQQRKDAVAKRANLVAAISARAAAAKDSAEHEATEIAANSRPVARYLTALDNVPFRRLGGDVKPVSAAYRKLIEAALITMNDGCVTVAMTWPARDVSLSAMTSLIAIADIAAAPESLVMKGGVECAAFMRPRGLRALLYPYARSTHKYARQVLVDRDHLRAVSLKHALRHTDGIDGHAALKDYHQVLARAGKLTGRARDGKEAPEFAHPVLDEILPHGSCDGAVHENGRLLWRSSAKTDLKFHTRTGLADNGKAAEFFLHGLKYSENPRRALRGIGALDLAIFDLTRTGQGRLGDEWPEDSAEVFKVLRQRHPKVGVLVVVDEPWSFDKCRFEVFNEQKTVKHRPRRPERSLVITAHGGAVIGAESPPSSFAGATKFEARTFRGAALELADELRGVGEKLRQSGEKTGMRSIRDLVSTLRRNASLPGSLSSLSDYVIAERGPVLANEVMNGYRVSGHVAALVDAALPAFQIGGARLVEALGSVEGVFRNQQTQTPMSLLMEAALTGTRNSAGRSLFMFQSQPIADFAIDEFTRRLPWLRKKMESRMIVFSGQGGLSDIAGLDPSQRNQFKKLYLVAPPRNGVLSYLARSWLPELVIVLADADTLRFSSRDAMRLAGQIDEPAIGSRLRRYGMETAKAVEAIGSYAVKLDEVGFVPDDVKFPGEPVVDLTGGKGYDRERIEIKLTDGPRIMAWPGSALVLQDRSHSVDEFREIAASAVTEGDRICVLSAGFVERARLVLSIPAAAAGEIRDYHELVLKKFAEVPGNSESERLRVLVDRMNDAEIDINRARYWVSLKRQLEVRIDEVVPHAPQKIELFLKFTAALGIGERMAREFWQWGVLAQRTTRLKAGMAFHDAYRGILVDPFAAMADNQKRSQEIRRLRLLAEDYVATVESVERVKP